MKLAIVGSRTFNDYEVIEEHINAQREIHDNLTLISGGTNGVGKLTIKYAQMENLDIEVIRLSYKNNPPDLVYLIRNREIAFKCDQMLAFWDGKSRGTKNVIEHAVSLKKFVMIQGV